jgi:ribosome recycling factor
LQNSIRNLRHDALHNIKTLKDEGISEDDIKHGEDLTQKVTDEHTKKTDELVHHKEEEIMKV